MDRPGVRQVPEGSGEQGKMEGTLPTLAVKGLMMMMMMVMTQESLRSAAVAVTGTRHRP